MYGEDDNPDKFVPFIVQSLRKNVESIALTPGNQKRDFIYVDDVAEAYLSILKHTDEWQWFSEYDVGTGESIRLRDFVETVKSLSGSKTKLDFGALSYREDEIMESHADIRALQNFGWQPRYDINEGILQILK